MPGATTLVRDGRVLTLTECETEPRDKALTQAVLREYCRAATMSSHGSVRELRARLAAAMRDGELELPSPFVPSTPSTST